jgi:glycosyltransferase involved in cell wall biosynthesis
VRFLFVAAFAPTADSGAAGTLLAIAAALRALGHHVDLEWQPPGPGRIRHATASRLVELPRQQLRQVAQRLSRSTYDVVIVSQPFAYLVYEQLQRRYPRTLFLNRTHGWEARLYEAQRRLAFGEPQGTAGRWLSRLAERLTRRACARTARAARAILAPSSRCAEYVRAAYDLPAERVPVIPYGLGDAAPPIARAPGRRMLFVGNVLPLKGSRVLQQVLPPVASAFPDATVTFVADGRAAPSLERHLRPAFGDRLRVLPWMERERLDDVYAAHDLLLFPSLFEGFGKVWMEAMAAGLCVVGFAEGGLPDVAANGREAWYCAPGDAAGLAALLHGALDDPPRSAELGSRARETVLRYSWERTARETVDHCLRLAAR